MRHPTDRPRVNEPAGSSGPWVLTRDGVEVITGTELECWQWIHSHTSFSVDHACRHEGYTMRPAQVPDNRA